LETRIGHSGYSSGGFFYGCVVVNQPVMPRRAGLFAERIFEPRLGGLRWTVAARLDLPEEPSSGGIRLRSSVVGICMPAAIEYPGCQASKVLAPTT